MKLRSLKIGSLIISPKMLMAIMAAFFIAGIGIGVTVVSPGSSKLALLMCSILSIGILSYALSKGKISP
jgi:hypothetical protein